ncbi:hypothetical protein C8J57DRAFT_1512726 [Mycena rebaudengoi]|nr:hypothetical protein C8J57DRAFT_1512726 [Mycena rebaudengoi]
MAATPGVAGDMMMAGVDKEDESDTEFELELSGCAGIEKRKPPRKEITRLKHVIYLKTVTSRGLCSATLPSATSWDLADIRAVDFESLPPSAVTSVQAISSDPSDCRIILVSREEEPERRQFLRKDHLRRARLTLLQSSSKAIRDARAETGQARADARVEVEKAKEARAETERVRADARVEAGKAKAKAEQANAKAKADIASLKKSHLSTIDKQTASLKSPIWSISTNTQYCQRSRNSRTKYARVSVDAQDLPAFCVIAKRQHGFLRNEQQHPRPTLHYAERVLETIAHDIQQSAVLDILFAQAIIRDHMDLFAPAEADDPRRKLEDEIADLEAQRAMLDE